MLTSLLFTHSSYGMVKIFGSGGVDSTGTSLLEIDDGDVHRECVGVTAEDLTF